MTNPVPTIPFIFCGESYNLQALTNDQFEELYDAVIDYGSDLADQGAALPLNISSNRKEEFRKALSENSRLLFLLDCEAERRRTLPATAGPQLCPDCSQLCKPLDTSELCDACMQVCTDYESDRYIEPYFYEIA